MRPQDLTQQPPKRRRFDGNASARPVNPNRASPYYGQSNQPPYPPQSSGNHPNNRSNFATPSQGVTSVGQATSNSVSFGPATPAGASAQLNGGSTPEHPQDPNPSGFRGTPPSRTQQRQPNLQPSGDHPASGGHRAMWLPPPSAVTQANAPPSQPALPALFDANGNTNNSNKPHRPPGFPPFNNPASAANGGFPPHTLPPLSVPGIPPPLRVPVDPFPQQWSPIEPIFRDSVQAPSGPVVPHGLPTRASALGNVRGYANTTSPMSSRPPQGSSKPSNVPSPSLNAAGFNRNQHSKSRSKALGVSSNPLDALLSIRMIHPVKEALSLFRDGSPIMVALAQTITQSGHTNMPGNLQRDRILNFKGFQPHSQPKTQYLLSLSKNDLEILAWVFVVSKHGKKEEVARRILASLRMPLKFRTPPPTKRPTIPARIDARPRSGSNAPATTPPSAARQNGRAVHSSRQRGNMPTLAVPNVISPRADSFLKNLQRQLDHSDVSNAVPSVPAPSHFRYAPQQNRTRQMRNLCHELLQGYSFRVAENPFNEPMNPPLGAEKYVVFSSMQLSRGNHEPVLKFATPGPIDANVRPEVRGGDVQVHIRCLRIEIEKPKSEWKQAWPFPAACRVNGTGVQLNQAQRYTNGKLAGRDAATNISPFLRNFKSSGTVEMNRVTLRRQASNATAATGQFVFFAQEVLVLSTETMTKSVFDGSDKYWADYRRNQESKGLISSSTTKFEMARQGVMQFLTDPDGLTVSSMKVSLRCPLALTRISTPVKGRRCQHVQCFDLQNFLEYARRSSKFDCPVCNKNTAFPSMLVISPYIEHALEKFTDCDEVEIFQDGSMVLVERKQNGVASDDDEEEGASRQASKGKRGTGASSGNAAEVVDLTLDSDDDDVPVVSTTQARGGANGIPYNVRTQGQQANQAGDGGAIGSEVQQIEQDVDFSFRADFSLWGDQAQVSDEGGPGTPQGAGRDNWACDVIAIDSD